MWDEILSGAEEKFIFHSKREIFAIGVGVGETGFETLVQVQMMEM